MQLHGCSLWDMRKKRGNQKSLSSLPMHSHWILNSLIANANIISHLTICLFSGHSKVFTIWGRTTFYVYVMCFVNVIFPFSGIQLRHKTKPKEISFICVKKIPSKQKWEDFFKSVYLEMFLWIQADYKIFKAHFMEFFLDFCECLVFLVF